MLITKNPTYFIYIYIMSKIGKSIETESKLSSYLRLLGERADRVECNRKGAGGQYLKDTAFPPEV